MRIPFSVFLSLRYLRLGKGQFISFISLISMLGIGLGVAVLIVVMSVMNGFKKEVSMKMLDLSPQITLVNWGGDLITDFDKINTDYLKSNSQVTGASPFVSGQGMMVHGKNIQGAYLKGIDTDTIESVIPISEHLIAGKLENLKIEKFGVILSEKVSKQLRASLGDKVTMVLPLAEKALSSKPIIKNLTVVGICKGGWSYDAITVYVSLETARKLLKLPENVNHGISISTKNPNTAEQTKNMINYDSSGQFVLFDWTQENAEYFKAFKTEKTMLFLVLLLVIAVAAFNLISILVIIVSEKKTDIAILRTLGARRRTILATFMGLGFTIGLFGTILGVLIGVLISNNITEVANFVEYIFSFKIFASEIFAVDELPADLQLTDIIVICSSSLILSVLASLYPAIKATKLKPAEALHHV